MSARPFSGALQKIERAKQHIRELETVFEAFRQKHPYHLVVKDGAKAGEKGVSIELDEPLPCNVPTIIGDAAHNLRTALDHMVWELVTLDGGTPGRHNEFPFDETREKFEAAAERKVDGAKPQTIKLIKETKAYRGGDRALWGLNVLDRTDKHRTMIPVVVPIKIHYAEMWVGGKLAVEVGENLLRPADNGVATMFGVGPGVTLKFTEKTNPTVEIRFPHGGDVFQGDAVIPTLAQLAQAVAGVVETFRAYKS